MQIENRVFLITGAGSGLGAAVSKMAVEAGAKVVLLDVNAEAGEAGAKALGAWRFGQIPAHRRRKRYRRQGCNCSSD
ncbi:Dehydrogenases with different specificities (related to short-chain alcohol dehydrogenases) [Brucella abortus A13334]|nr:Dehydrogenases with different specificities (related to short-chain alcohol dehydrogenases) [Brucella abortus A13334]